MKIVWASWTRFFWNEDGNHQDSESLNGCRLFYNMQEAIDTIDKEMLESGRIESDRIKQEEGSVGILKPYINQNKEDEYWLFAEIEVEGTP